MEPPDDEPQCLESWTHGRAQGVFPGGVSHNVRAADLYPIYIDRIKGPNVYDVDENEYVDFWNNHGASLTLRRTSVFWRGEEHSQQIR